MYFLFGFIIYLALASAVAYGAFARDKQFAISNKGIPRGRKHAALRAWRTPEKQLLFWAIIGGWPGAKLAQHRLRHKSFKEPFRTQLNQIGLMQGAILGTFTLIVGSLFLLAPEPYAIPRAEIAAPAIQTADASPDTSLRPPTLRPATW